MLKKILQSRDIRAKRQKEFLALYKKPLISVTVNIPGSNKLTDESVFIYEVMTNCLKKRLENFLHVILHVKKDTGVEGIFYTDLDAKKTKKICVDIEDNKVLGRFIDFDVIDVNGKILSRKDFGFNSRRCYLCDKKAVICARSRSHELKLLLNYIKFCVKSYKQMLQISQIAKNSLIKELELTPKPGLVDMNDSGSHKDMDKFTFYKSIKSISEYFLPFLSVGFLNPKDPFNKLREVGLSCEKSMLKATKGVNTHKGAIFSYAVILGSVGALLKDKKPLYKESLQEAIKSTCKNLIKHDLSDKKEFKSAGERFYKKTKNAGIRKEAQNGYPSIFDISLPFYQKCKKRFNEEKALKLTLLKLISEIEDTTLYNRGGLEGLEFAKKEAKTLLLEFHEEKLPKLNKLFVKKDLSPGGSADMLAITWFLDNVLEI